MSLFLTFAWLIGITLGHAAEVRQIPACVAERIHEEIYGPANEETRELPYDLFQLKRKSPELTQELNQRVLELLKSEPLPMIHGSKANQTLASHKIDDLYSDVMANPQVRESLCGSYNGSPGGGYCWGRALAVHLKALQSGLTAKSARKVWIVGSLKNGRKKWQYHVTTIVRGEGGRWIAVDPILPRPMPIEEWLESIRTSLDPSGTARIFATPASRYSPEEHRKYSHLNLSEENYFYGFFSDLLDTISRENIGRPSSWAKVSLATKERVTRKAREARRKRLLKAIKRAGIPIGTGGLGYLLYKFRDPKSSESER
jgi:hypothetical protein